MKANANKKTKARSFVAEEEVLVLLPVADELLKQGLVDLTKSKRDCGVNYVVNTADKRKGQRVCHINMLKKYFDREDKQEEVLVVVSKEKGLEIMDCGQKLKYEPSFSEGMMNVYTYEGVILTGLPESGLNRAGVRINCGLNIIPMGQNTYLLKITRPQILEYNGIWPSHSFFSAHKLTQRLAPELLKPVTFEYNKGQVGKIQAPADLLEDILNIHRGILNIFQITMKKSQNFYGLQEAGIEGVCLTNYIIQENKKAHRITITKSKDLNNCQEKVMIFTGAAYADPVCQQRSRNIRASATFTHVLKPTATGAILQEARVREVHQFTPFHEGEGTAILEARQHLTLVNIKAAVMRELHVKFVDRGTLKYHFDENVLRKPMKLMKAQSVEKVILETLKNLELHNQEKVNSDTPAKFLQLVQLLRSTTEGTIASVWQGSHSNQFRRWILFALPAVGTLDALRFLKTAIQNMDITMADATQALGVVMHQITANLQSLSLVKEILEILPVEQFSIPRQVVHLGYGSMVFRYCVQQVTCPDNLLKPLHDLLTLATAQGNEEDIALSLKSIGNAGQPASTKSVIKLLPGFGTAAASLPLKLQVDAIMTLRNIAKKDPEKVQTITIQVFMNRRNHPELRMSACAIFLCTKPPLNSLLVLANSLLKEPSLQVASFAYSQFRSLARSSLPSHSSLLAGCNLAAKLLSPRFDRLGLKFSQVFHPDLFSYKLMSGLSAKAILINNVGGPIPTLAAAKVTGHTLGFSSNLAEVGLRMEGLQEVMMKGSASVRGGPDVKQIQHILNGCPDWKSLPEKVPLASAYMKLFDQEITFVEFRKDDIHKAIQVRLNCGKHSTLRKLVNRLQKPIELQPAAALLTAELRRLVPTCMGLPMELSFLSAAVAKANLNVDAKVPSSISSFSQLLNADIQLKAQLNPSVAMYSKAIMEINTPFIQSGLEFEAKIHSAFPVDVSAKINVKERNLKIDSAAAQEENRIISFKSEVFAISRNIENLSAARLTPIVPEAKEPSITNQKFKPSGRYVDTQPYLGLHFKSNLQRGFHFQQVPSKSNRVLGFLSRNLWYYNKNIRAIASQTLVCPILENPDLCSGIVMDEFECYDEVERPPPRPSVTNTCLRVTTFGFDVCLDAKMASAVFIRHGPLHRLMGVHTAKLLIRPAQSGAHTERLLLEVQAGPKAGSKIIRSLEEEEPLPERIHRQTVLFKEHRSQTGIQNQTWTKSSSSSSISKSSSGSRTTSRSSLLSNDRLLKGHHNIDQKQDRQGRPSRKRSSGTNRRSSSSSSRYMSSGSTQGINQGLMEIVFKSTQSSERDLIGDISAPSLIILAQAKRTDGKLQGYQLTGSVQSSDGRPKMHLRIVDLKEDSRWKMCVDAAIPKAHKAMIMYRWGENCQRYKISYKASMGHLQNHPSMKIKTQWSEIPEVMIVAGRMIGSGAAYLLGFSNKFKVNPSRQITYLITLTSPRTIDTIVKLPKFTIYYQGFELPLPVHVQTMAPIIRTQGFKSFAEIPRLLLTMNQRECIAENERVVTFDSNELTYKRLNDCHYVLTKDCSPSPKFVLLMRRADNQQRKKAIKLLISVPNVVIEAYPTQDGIKFMVDNVETSLSNQGKIIQNLVTIRQNGTGISLEAPSISIDQLYFDGYKVQVVLDQMMSKTCGICGINNGEQKMMMPNQEEARDVEGLFESWTYPGQSCTDDCKVRRNFVELGKTAQFEGQEFKCYSAEPVQRCLEGCSPIETLSRIVNFQCVPANRPVDAAFIFSFRKKSVDMSHPVDLHADCSCHCTDV
ncbi:vitellogenin-like [Carcharodon carcharias]|uniref:vitellogenin-like n=1 Tax=Carcharodon carcharias TaxID=13397 RepID=UPI001B7E6A36|nr:vitellogenin-like [Carcharodon carcharias]